MYCASSEEQDQHESSYTSLCKFTQRQTTAKQMHHRLAKVNPQNPDSTIRASSLTPDLTIWLQKHTENVLAVLMISITMVFYSCSKPHRRSLVGIFKYSLHQTCLGKEPPKQMLPCKAEGKWASSLHGAARQAGKASSSASKVIQSSHIIWRELCSYMEGQ